MRRIEGEDLPYPWEIIYTRWQFEWLLKPLNWSLIKIGQWPFAIQDDAMKQAGVSHHAAFENISLIKAEIEMRLESTGKDGNMCRARYFNEDSDSKISVSYNVPLSNVGKRIKRAMRYMSGKRKSISYSEWIANGWRENRR